MRYKIYVFGLYAGPVLALIILFYFWWFVRQARDGMPDIEDVELSEYCQDCKEEFGHPDNCIGCPEENSTVNQPRVR